DGVVARITDIRERAVDRFEAIPGVEAVGSGADRVERQVTQHPMTSMLAGLGVGLAIGMASGQVMPDLGKAPPTRAHVRRDAPPQEKDEEETSPLGARVRDTITATALSIVAGPLRSEVQT